MNTLKKILAILCIVGGAILAVYWGAWCLFIGGLVQLIMAAQKMSGNLLALNLAIGLGKVLISGIVGWFVFYISFAIGMTIGLTIKEK